MLVLAIDPGYTTGWAVLDNLKVIALGKIKAKASLSTPARIKIIHDGISEVLKQHSGIKHVVIENQFQRRNTKTLMILSRVVGAILAAVANHGIENIFWYAPTTVKQTVTGHGGADKKIMVDYICQIFKHQHIVAETLQTKKVKGAAKIDDIADALALAYTYYTVPDQCNAY